MPAIYHITQIGNLNSILEQTGLHCDKERVRTQLHCIGIAHQHIKERRGRRPVPKAKNGTLDDYVPFYFAPRTPMLYSIHRGFVEGYTGGEDSILHLESTTELVQQSGISFTYTDGHAEMAVSQFFEDLAEINVKVDWEVMNSRYWNDTAEYPDRKRKRQAEFLVYKFAPLSLVQRIGVKDNGMKARVEDILKKRQNPPPVEVKREWYYG